MLVGVAYLTSYKSFPATIHLSLLSVRCFLHSILLIKEILLFGSELLFLSKHTFFRFACHNDYAHVLHNVPSHSDVAQQEHATRHAPLVICDHEHDLLADDPPLVRWFLWVPNEWGGPPVQNHVCSFPTGWQCMSCSAPRKGMNIRFSGYPRIRRSSDVRRVHG